jgi:6-phosphogluconolactonase (cycloisomerase 2 family)
MRTRIESPCGIARIVVIATAAVVLLAMALTGCGSSSHAKKIYVVGVGTPNVEMFDVSSSGMLTANTSFAGTGGQPDAIIVGRKFAYVLDSSGASQPGGITEYLVAGTGTLSSARTSQVLSTTTLSATPPKTGINPLAMVIDANSKFVFVANQASDSISVFSVDSGTGLLTEVTGSPFATAAGPSGLAIVSNSLFVANQGAGAVSVYTFDQTSGSLTQVSGSPIAAGTSPTALDVDSAGKFLFVADPASNGVLAFSVSGNSLTPVAGSPFAAGTTPVHLRIVGSSVFVANSGSGNISAFTIGSSGALTPVSGSPFSAGSNPVYIASVSGGTQLFVANQGTNNISAFQVGSGGILTAVSGSPFSTALSGLSAIAGNF